LEKNNRPCKEFDDLALQLFKNTVAKPKIGHKQPLAKNTFNTLPSRQPTCLNIIPVTQSCYTLTLDVNDMEVVLNTHKEQQLDSSLEPAPNIPCTSQYRPCLILSPRILL